MQNDFYVFVNGFETLSEAVQKEAFKAGYSWNAGRIVQYTDKKYLVFSGSSIRRIKHGEFGGYRGVCYDARTQFEEIVKALRYIEPKPVDPYQRFKTALANGKRVLFRIAGRQEWNLHSVINGCFCYTGGPENYAILGEDLPMLPTTQQLKDWGVKLTGRCVLTTECKCFIGLDNNRHSSGPVNSYGDNYGGIRWECEKVEPPKLKYLPHIWSTMPVGAVVIDRHDAKRKAVIVSSGDTGVTLGAGRNGNYTFVQLLNDWILESTNEPCGIKQ